MDARSLLVCGLIASSSFVAADLRMASQPKGNYVVRQRNAVQFVSKTALYMEPSAFDYPGLITQREKAYDNFLRSNIDNEQDKRNFHNTVGRDMLPVRSFESAETDASATVQNKIPANGPGPAITATPDQAYIVPLRWNNPHASELEVNVWISDMKYVVPIRKPTCSGEGRQDNVFAFTIPKDFNDLGKVVPGWTGCKKVGDCVLQIYAHSVEPRTYAIGTPLIVTGDVPAATATNTNGIQPAGQDPGLDLSKQPNEVCLSSASPLADITTAVPRQARLISDVANHAYQNSNYSPYSGQQPEAISKNLQASVIISMIPANRGELGKALLKKENPAAAAFQKNLAAKAQNLVKQYEGVVNKIIAQIGDKQLKTTATLGEQNEQKLANSFRAAQVGSVTTTRLKTNTYIPSFQLETQDQIDAAKKLVPAAYKGLISSTGVVQLYQAVLNDLKGEFNKAASLGLEYMGPVYKPTAATLESPTKHRKLTAQGRRDQGEYATSLFKASQKAAPKQAAFAVEQTTLLSVLSSCSDAETCSYPDTDAEAMQDTHDMEAMNMDGGCDNDDAPADADCNVQGAPLFKLDADGNIEEVNANTATATVINTIMLVATATLGALLWA